MKLTRKAILRALILVLIIGNVLWYWKGDAIWRALFPLPKETAYDLYVPPVFDRSVKHPLVLVLSPSGNPSNELPVWKEACDRHQWLWVGSRNYRNYDEFYFHHFTDAVAAVASREPVDRARVYVGGISGGGTASYEVVWHDPEVFRGIVINTGRRWPESFTPEALAKDPFPRGKVAVHLASPTDFRYAEMKQDRQFLEQVGWNVLWREFEGGHALAPRALYEEGIAWLDSTR